MRDYLDFTRSNAAVYVPMPDVGSTRISEIRRELERYIEVEKAHLVSKGVDVKITITGMFAIGEDIYKTLVDGLLWSLSLAVLVSFTVFSGVLGSWRLGMIALIPNLLPLVLTFGFMGATGIDLNPNTVMVFCITLVIADDDTVQFFTRFKIQLERLIEREPNHPTPHFTAAIEVLRLSGLPMFVTACAVALGFSTFLVSNFIGIANVGVLIGVSLFAAVFGDLFVTPILLAKLKPKVVVVTPATGTSGTGAAT